MSPLARRSSRLVWTWCLAYTALATPVARERRRGELRNHLWESEHAGVAGLAVALAASRGLASDLLWALSTGVPRVARSFGTPTPYVVLAPLFPLQGWFVSAAAVGATAHFAQGLGAIGGGAMLGLAGVAWWLQRGRN